MGNLKYIWKWNNKDFMLPSPTFNNGQLKSNGALAGHRGIPLVGNIPALISEYMDVNCHFYRYC